MPKRDGTIATDNDARQWAMTSAVGNPFVCNERTQTECRTTPEPSGKGRTPYCMIIRPTHSKGNVTV